VAILLPPNLTEHELRNAIALLSPNALLLLDLSQQSLAGACSELLQRSHPFSVFLSGVPQDANQFRLLRDLHTRRVWLRRASLLSVTLLLGAYVLWCALGLALASNPGVWTLPVPWLVAIMPSLLQMTLLFTLKKAVLLQ
jgi:hypothetical protein